ncbi:TLD, putative [Entamoeba histolytica]
MEELINKNNQLIKELVETLPNIQRSIDDTTKNYQYYIGSIKNEIFEIKDNETYSEAIKRGEGIFDRIDETERRRKLVIEKSQETINQIEIMKNKMSRIIEECKSDEETLSKTRNELIDKIISIEEMIMKDKLFRKPQEKDKITSEFNKKKEEWETYYSDYLERKKREEEERRKEEEERRKEEEERRQQQEEEERRQQEEEEERRRQEEEEERKRQEEEEERKKQEQERKIQEHERKIQEHEKKIQEQEEERKKQKEEQDRKIQEQERKIQEQERKTTEQEKKIQEQERKIKQQEEERNKQKEEQDKKIQEQKEEQEKKIQEHERKIQEYERKTQEQEKKIQQLEKLRIIREERKEEERLRIMKGMSTIEEIRQIEEWTNRKVGNILFDSDIDNWNKNTSVFDQRIMNKEHIIIIIEDEEGNKFGGYVNSKINKVDKWISDSKSFVFSLESKGRIEGMMKFDIKQPQCAFWLFNQSYDCLFSFGYYDICVYKENNKTESHCYPRSFEYKGISKALCGNEYPEYFTPKRIIVIEMK